MRTSQIVLAFILLSTVMTGTGFGQNRRATSQDLDQLTQLLKSLEKSQRSNSGRSNSGRSNSGRSNSGRSTSRRPTGNSLGNAADMQQLMKMLQSSQKSSGSNADIQQLMKMLESGQKSSKRGGNAKSIGNADTQQLMKSLPSGDSFADIEKLLGGSSASQSRSPSRSSRGGKASRAKASRGSATLLEQQLSSGDLEQALKLLQSPAGQQAIQQLSRQLKAPPKAKRAP